MPTTDNAPREAFCLALKTTRERRGLTLAEIAAVTKVCPSHFAALERGDLRGWPKGLFRRAFFRGYVEMVGWPVAEAMDEFVRLFPDDGGAAANAAAADDSPRLALDASWRGTAMPVVWRLAAAAIDAAVVTGLAVAVAWPAEADLAMAAAVASAGYFTLATLVFGESPAARAIRRRRWRAAVTAGATAEPAADAPSIAGRAWQHVVDTMQLVVGGGGETAGDGHEERQWTTDAQRVRPRSVPPRIRVRFKVSP